MMNKYSHKEAGDSIRCPVWSSLNSLSTTTLFALNCSLFQRAAAASSVWDWEVTCLLLFLVKPLLSRTCKDPNKRRSAIGPNKDIFLRILPMRDSELRRPPKPCRIPEILTQKNFTWKTIDLGIHVFKKNNNKISIVDAGSPVSFTWKVQWNWSQPLGPAVVLNGFSLFACLFLHLSTHFLWSRFHF